MARDFKRVLEALPEGAIVLDAVGCVELVNAEACRMLELSEETSLAQLLRQLLADEHPLGRLAGSALAEGRPVIEGERVLHRTGDGDLVVDAAAAPLFDDQRRVDGVVLLLRDRTIHQTLHTAVSEHERLETLGRMATGIAHEVKNPLGGIRGAAELLAARVSEDKLKATAGLIVREVDRIAALVDELMVFTRAEDVQFAPVNIHRVLDEVLELSAMEPAGAEVVVKRDFDPSIPELLADPDRLSQVFLNLVRNALQALAEVGGTLTIRTAVSLAHRLSSSGGEQDSTLLIEIADSGPGMPPEVLERLATPFFTTRKGGTGLGIAVARQWLARHGGALRIDSTPGEGTVASVTLPLRRAS